MIENNSENEETSRRNKIIAGLEDDKIKSDFYPAKDRATKLHTSGKDSDKNTSDYLEEKWQMSKFSLTPGVRYDRYEAPDFIAGGKTYDNVVGALAASYEIAPSTQVFASYTQLFNGPDLGQAIFNRDGAGTVVNNDLKAEEGDNTEVGIVTTLHDLTQAV